jgi:hypothetical protein
MDNNAAEKRVAGVFWVLFRVDLVHVSVETEKGKCGKEKQP